MAKATPRMSTNQKAATPPAKRTPRKKAGSIPELNKVQDGEAIGPATLPPHDTTKDVPAHDATKPPLWQQAGDIFRSLPLTVWVVVAVILFFIIMGTINNCNSARRIVEKHNQEIAPHQTRIKALQQVNDSLAAVAIEAKREAIEAEVLADKALSQLEIIMQERNLSAARQEQVRQTIKKQTDETTKRINGSTSFADLDRQRDSIRSARKQADFD